MNKSEEDIIKRIESIPIDQAREALIMGKFGHYDSPGYHFASSLISRKDSSLRDAREAETLSLAKEANSIAREANLRTSSVDRFTRRAMTIDRIIAIAAIIIAAIAAREDIKWFISWVIKYLRKCLG